MEFDVDVLVLIGRILFSGIFLTSALAHFTAGEQLTQYAQAKNVPQPRAAVFVGGLLLLTGGLSVLFGVWADLGALLLVIFLVPTAILIHGFWREREEARASEQNQFFKDIGLAGAALMLLALFSYIGSDLGLTITGPLFEIE